MKKILFPLLLAGFVACSKNGTDSNSETLSQQKIKSNQLVTNEGNTNKNPGPIDTLNEVSATPTYLIPSGNGSYYCSYAGIGLSFTSVSFSTATTPIRTFNDYGTYFANDATGAATITSGTASVQNVNNNFTIYETYCKRPLPPGTIGTSLCAEWGNRELYCVLVNVLNPPAGAPSSLALVPYNYFTGNNMPILPY